MPRQAAEKVFSREALLARYGPPRAEKVVFTNGCFDLIHRGHVTYLAAARALGDVLVVGVNTDASVRGLDKAERRPVVSEADRAHVVASLETVDAVCLFDEHTPAELIGRLLPDVLVKGGDYLPEDVVGRETVEAAGGRLEIIPLIEGYSTTDLVARIRTRGG